MNRLTLTSVLITILFVLALININWSWSSRDFKENRELIIQECESFITNHAGKKQSFFFGQFEKPIEFIRVKNDSVLFSIESSLSDEDFAALACHYKKDEGHSFTRDYSLELMKVSKTNYASERSITPIPGNDFFSFYCDSDGLCECYVEEFCVQINEQ